MADGSGNFGGFDQLKQQLQFQQGQSQQPQQASPRGMVGGRAGTPQSPHPLLSPVGHMRMAGPMRPHMAQQQMHPQMVMQGGQIMQPQHNPSNIMGMMNPQHAGPNATSPASAKSSSYDDSNQSGNAAAWPGPAIADPAPSWSNDDATELQHCRPARAVPASPATTSSATASNRRTSRLSHVPVKSANCSVCFAPSGQSKISVKYNNIDSIKNEIRLFYHHYHPQTIKCSSCPLVLLRHRRRILNKRDFHNPSIDSLREKVKDAQLVQ